MSAPVSDVPWTLAALVSWTTEFLKRSGVDEPRLSAEVLLSHAMQMRRIDLYTRFDQVPDAAKIDSFRALVRRASAGEPIAYLVGRREFFSLPFQLNSSVLIPRPETETLVEFAVAECVRRSAASRETSDAPGAMDSAQSRLGPKAMARDESAANQAEPTNSRNGDGRSNLHDESGAVAPIHLWEIGAGSGCVCVAAAWNVPNARIVASDISVAALEVARENARINGVEARIRFAAADMLQIPSEFRPLGGFDVILCNPPYVPVHEWKALHPTVRDFEPALALTDGDDGLSFYRALGQGAGEFLAKGGVMAFEVGDHRAAVATAAVLASGRWTHVQTLKDRTVGMDRVIVFRVAGDCPVDRCSTKL